MRPGTVDRKMLAKAKRRCAKFTLVGELGLDRRWLRDGGLRDLQIGSSRLRGSVPLGKVSKKGPGRCFNLAWPPRGVSLIRFQQIQNRLVQRVFNGDRRFDRGVKRGRFGVLVGALPLRYVPALGEVADWRSFVAGYAGAALIALLVGAFDNERTLKRESLV